MFLRLANSQKVRKCVCAVQRTKQCRHSEQQTVCFVVSTCQKEQNVLNMLLYVVVQLGVHYAVRRSLSEMLLTV